MNRQNRQSPPADLGHLGPSRARRSLRHPLAAIPLACALLLGGCTLLMASGGGAREDRTLSVTVEVREEPESDLWSVSYRLPGSAAGVEMVRSREAFRADLWSAVAAGAEARWHREGEVERLCFDRPSSAFALAMRSDFRPRAKDYELHVPFTDGSRLLYTGHLQVRPLSRCGDGSGSSAAEPMPGNVVHRWRFVTTPERGVRVLDGRGAGELEWAPAAARGEGDTYVYFGSLPGMETGRVILVLDPGLPAWVTRDLERLVPGLLDHYAFETAVELPVRPLLLVSFAGFEGRGRTVSGGTLNGLAQLALRGEGWAEESPEGRLDWFHHLAHEIFHLWAGETLRPDHESEWLSEAAAELFALEAGRRFGLIEPRQLAETLVEKANTCLTLLGGAALLRAPERGAWDAFYTCGPVLLHLAGAAVERGQAAGTSPAGTADPATRQPAPDGLATLFRHLFDEALHRDSTLSTGLFLGWLDKLSGERQTVHHLQHLLRRGVDRGADRYLLALLQQAGMPVSLVPLEEAGATPTLYRRLLAEALTRCACGEEEPPEGAVADGAGEMGADECSLLRAGTAIWRLDDIDAHRAPGDAWARLRSAVALQQPVRVVTADDSEPLLLLCSASALEGSINGLLRLE